MPQHPPKHISTWSSSRISSNSNNNNSTTVHVQVVCSSISRENPNRIYYNLVTSLHMKMSKLIITAHKVFQVCSYEVLLVIPHTEWIHITVEYLRSSHYILDRYPNILYLNFPKLQQQLQEQRLLKIPRAKMISKKECIRDTMHPWHTKIHSVQLLGIFRITQWSSPPDVCQLRQFNRLRDQRKLFSQ